jgi:hypothetical protein
MHWCPVALGILFLLSLAYREARGRDYLLAGMSGTRIDAGGAVGVGVDVGAGITRT